MGLHGPRMGKGETAQFLPRSVALECNTAIARELDYPWHYSSCFAFDTSDDRRPTRRRKATPHDRWPRHPSSSRPSDDCGRATPEPSTVPTESVRPPAHGGRTQSPRRHRSAETHALRLHAASARTQRSAAEACGRPPTAAPCAPAPWEPRRRSVSPAGDACPTCRSGG